MNSERGFRVDKWVNLLDARTWSLSVYFQTSGNTLGTSKEPSYKLFCFIWRFVWSLERIILAILEASLKYLESLNSNYLRHLSPWMAGSHLPGLPSWPWCNFRVGAQVVQPRPRMLRYEILVESQMDVEIFDFGGWVVSNVFFLFTPILGKWSNLTKGWNHQLVFIFMSIWP